MPFLNQIFNSGWFLAIQIVSGAVSLFLLVVTAHLIRETGYPQRHLRHLWIAWNKGTVPKNKMIARWQAIEDSLRGEDAALWRRAILDADNMLYETVSRMGYGGETFEEKLENITPEQFPSFAEAWKAHQVSQFIAEDPSYLPTREVAERTLEIYRNMFSETGIIL